MMQNIAIVGAGAVGGTVAAWLAQRSDLAITVCVRTRIDVLEIDTPVGPISARPRVWTQPAEAQAVDWVLIATKTYDAAGASLWLNGLVNEHTRVAVLQNGVEHVELFAPYVSPRQILPAVVDIPAERSASPRIWQRRVGRIVIPQEPGGAEFARLFAHTPISVSTTDDFLTAAWEKLCLNCTGAVSALTLKPAGVVGHAGVAEIMRALAEECAAVGRAQGAQLAADLPAAIVERQREAPPDSINSMHADLIAGRMLELDARNGAIVRLGLRHNIPTPTNQMIVALLAAATAAP